MIGRALAIALSVAATSSVFAFDESRLVAQTVALSDGSTLYILRNGKMAMQDRLGRAVSRPEAHVMLTQDGQTIRMVGNEVALLEYIQKRRTYGS